MNLTMYNLHGLGEKLMNEVNGDVIKEKFGIEEGIKLKHKLHEQRVDFIKKQNKSGKIL